MKNLKKERVERIVDLVEWFEEFQPSDLKQIERILLGLKYVNNEVLENELKKDMYIKIKLIKSEKFLQIGYSFINTFFREDVLNNNKKE